MSARRTVDGPSLDQEPWQALATLVLALPPHQPLEVGRHTLPHPGSCGFYQSTGLNRKCLHHFRKCLPDGRGLHVLVHRRRYVVHWDRVDPSVSVLRHFWHDVTRAMARTLRRIRLEAVSPVAWPLPSPLAHLVEPDPKPVPSPQG